MESKYGFPNETFVEKKDPSKNIMMEELSAVDPKIVSEEKSSTFTRQSYFHSFSRNTFKLSTIKEVKERMQERAKNVGASRVITLITILIIIGIFLIPIGVYYDNKADPLPELNSAFTDVNISMSPLHVCNNTIPIDYSAACTEEIIHTYEALKVASVFTNRFCAAATYKLLFCKALELCSAGQSVYATGLLCTHVRQQFCTAEWRILEVNNRSDWLIDCPAQVFGETATPNCTEQFDLADDSICLPLCKEFSQHGEGFTDGIVGLNGIVHLVNVIGGIIVIIACILNRTKMFKFPQILTLLNTCMITSVSFFIMLSNITLGSWNPICSQRYLTGHLSITGALNEPTAFCQIQGMVIFAGFVMYSVYWLLYAFHLYMKVAHPDYSMLFDSWHRTKKFYYIEVGVATLIGTLPYIILAGLEEFQIVQFPPLFCALSAEGNFYGIVFPTIIINCATVIILLLVLYHVHIHMGIFKKSETSWFCRITASEVKIFLIFCYLLAVLAVLWSSLTYDISKHDETAIKIGTYFRCSANGVHDRLDCEQYRKQFEDLSERWLHVWYLILVAFLSISNLPLIIEYKSVKDIIMSTLGRDTSVKETDLPSHTAKESELPSHTA